MLLSDQSLKPKGVQGLRASPRRVFGTASFAADLWKLQRKPPELLGRGLRPFLLAVLPILEDRPKRAPGASSEERREAFGSNSGSSCWTGATANGSLLLGSDALRPHAVRRACPCECTDARPTSFTLSSSFDSAL
jgi:hypothetical protein